MAHVPVMVAEVLRHLNPKPGKHFIDCTLGDGGHSRAILAETAPNGKVLGFDIDPEAIKVTKANLSEFGERLIAINANFNDMSTVVSREGFGPVSGVLLDFGFSSPQIEERGRGFSFQRDEPLDMRFSGGAMIGGGQELTAAEIVNSWPKDELVRILAEYGEERFADQIAAAIVTARRKQRMFTTAPLVEVIRNAVPAKYEQGRIHPATRTFQALRIAVNDELGNIERVLPQALQVLELGGVLVSIAFHSLEDRIIKDFFKSQESSGTLEVLTDTPEVAGEKETNQNPRARSAKLRAARRK